MVSKPASGQWARHELPSQWRSLIDSALRVYAGTATAGDLQWLRAQAESFCSFAEERIVAAPHRPNSARFDWSLSNGTVRLRPLDASDAAAHLAGEDEQQIRWMGGGRRSTLATVTAWIERNERAWREGGSRYNFGIWDEPRGQLAGNVEANLADPDLEPNEANISYVVFPAWRGRQYATQAVELVCQWLAAGRAHTAVVKLDPANTASIGVAERAGFSRTREIITTDGQRMTRLERSLGPTQGR